MTLTDGAWYAHLLVATVLYAVAVVVYDSLEESSEIGDDEVPARMRAMLVPGQVVNSLTFLTTFSLSK